MRKIDFVLTAAAVMMFAGCANDDNVINQDGGGSELTGATIGFNLTVPGQSRATLSGKDAAEKLNSEFVVFGIKNAVDDNTAAQNTFTNYKVKFSENSAGNTETNTNNWEYVGETPYAETLVSPAVTSQTVKYWDYSAKNGYTFTAFAGKDFLKGENTNAKVEKITEVADGGTEYDKGYKVTVPSAASLDKIFFADRKVVAKENFNKPVALTFRNFGAKVRVGFYETIPGYSVKIDNFYYDGNASAPVTTFGAMDTKPTDGEFVAALQNVNPSSANGNQVTVTYYGENTANENQPKVDCSSSSTYQYTLTLGSGIVGQTLGTTSTGATWDKNKEYTMVYPNLEATTPMLIRCDYTLTAEDGSSETIKVKNARVTVPVQYCQWKSNYAYTYLFKISDNTNGTTGDDPSDPDKPGDVEGLHPITFDAVVVESTDYAQETTTTVSTNSVTSYAKDGYNAKKDIYFVNTTKETADEKTSYKVLAPTEVGDAATNAQVYSVKWTSGNASIVEGDVLAQLTGVKNGLTMTAVTGTGAASLVQNVPSADGTNLDFGEKGALKFTPSAEGTYAYVYCTTKYAAPPYVDATGFTENTTYYANTSSTPADGVYYVASGITDAASYAKYLSISGRKLYKQTNKGTAGVYDIKVISVAAAQ